MKHKPSFILVFSSNYPFPNEVYNTCDLFMVRSQVVRQEKNPDAIASKTKMCWLNFEVVDLSIIL